MNGGTPLDEMVGDSNNTTVHISPMTSQTCTTHTTNTCACTCPLNSRSLQTKENHRSSSLSINNDDARPAASPIKGAAEPRLQMGTVANNTRIVPPEVDLPPFDAHFAEYETRAGDSCRQSAASYEDSEANKSSEASGHEADDAFHSNGTEEDPKSAPRPVGWPLQAGKRSCSQCRPSAAHLVFALVLLACACTFAGCAAPLLETSRRTFETHGERAAVSALVFSESRVEALLDNAISLGSAVRYSVRARQYAPIPSQDVMRPSDELAEELRCSIKRLNNLPMSWWQKWLSIVLNEVGCREVASVSVGFEDGSIRRPTLLVRG